MVAVCADGQVAMTDAVPSLDVRSCVTILATNIFLRSAGICGLGWMGWGRRDYAG